MAVITLPERPSLSNPARKKQMIEDAVHAMDQDITLLYCVAADVASTDTCPASETVESLQLVQARLRRSITDLLTLM